MFQIDSLASPWPIVRATADFAETLPPAGAHGHASAGVDVAAAAPRRGSAVQLQGIELRYPGSDVPALHGIDLDIAAGEVFGIIGRSGAGKSSLVRTINLLNRPSAGRVRVGGVDLTGLDARSLRAARHEIGMVFQHFNLLSSRTVYDNVALPLELAGLKRAEIRDRVQPLLELVGLAVLSLNRNQYMFLLPAVAGLVGAVLILSRPYPYQSPSATTSVKWILIGVACLLPMVIYHTAAQKNAEVSLWAATNRVNTVFGALVPASKDPAKMLKRMGLPPEGCMRFSEKTLFLTPQDEFNAYCPKSLTLPLHQIATAVLLEPAVLVAIVKTIAVHHSGFLQHHIGHVESANNGYIDHADQSNFDGAAFRTSRERTPLLTSQPYYGQSIDPLFRRISANSVMLLIWFVALGPALAALAAWAMKQRRWAFMFLLSGLLFNYALFSSILGDGYFELERHAILCFSFGALFFVLLGSWAVCTLSARPAPGKGTPDSHTA